MLLLLLLLQAELKAMQPHAALMNIARGGIPNQKHPAGFSFIVCKCTFVKIASDAFLGKRSG